MIEQKVIAMLRKGPVEIKDIAIKLETTQKEITNIIKLLKFQAYPLVKTNKGWLINKSKIDPKLGLKFPYPSREDNTFLFGFIGDTHLGSKYERLDVLNDLYDIFELEGVDRVYHAGNWVEGECNFNRHELIVHGMDSQMEYLVENYPKKDFATFAITGDDHEGWWGQRSGIDVGSHLQSIMRNNGRIDWFDLGFMEGYTELVNSNSGKRTQLLTMHPGGGSAYALSYKPQKIVESFSGGEKPSVLLIGHYHKMSYNMIRGVHTIQVGCTQDQTTFLRKKSIEAHVGGGICRLTQDPRTGLIFSCRVEFFRYYNKGFMNNKWNYKNCVAKPLKSLTS